RAAAGSRRLRTGSERPGLTAPRVVLFLSLRSTPLDRIERDLPHSGSWCTPLGAQVGLPASFCLCARHRSTELNVTRLTHVPVAGGSTRKLTCRFVTWRLKDISSPFTISRE